MINNAKIILAADELKLPECLVLTAQIGGRIHAIKIHNLYDQYGPAVVTQLRNAGARRVWVDAKLHDIPNTVKNRAKAIARAGADILTIHASGEVDMMMAAREGAPDITIYAITVLTSLSDEQVVRLYGKSTLKQVIYLAQLAAIAGMDGLVCSPKEVHTLASLYSGERDLVVPGIRSVGKGVDDQKRVDTPAAAIQSGATHLVMGRQILQAPDPLVALEEIEAEIAEVANEIQKGGVK